MHKPCPCGSQQSFKNCCEPLINEQKAALTPEQLMRSRYTAYTLGAIDYIEKSMTGPALKHFDYNAAKQWAARCQWQHLTILSSSPITHESEEGFVTFVAHYLENNQPQRLYERSRFIKRNQRWLYFDGSHTPKRNDPCYCGSGKKFKKCCLS